MTASQFKTNAASPHAVAAALLVAMLLLTIIWLGLNFLFPELQPTGIPSTVVRLIIHTTILAGLWLGLTRAGFDRRTSITVWAAIAIPFTAWLAAVWVLAVQGAFIPRPGIPSIPLAIFLPVLAGLALLLRSERVAAILDATPPFWLVALQVYRVFGGIFLVGWARGNLSGSFALPAGSGDVLVGLLALPVAYYLHASAPIGRTLAYAWNVLGLVDLAIAIGIGILSAPGPLQILPPDRPNALLGTFPTVMIPAFAVPSSILLHALSLRQLARMARHVS